MKNVEELVCDGTIMMHGAAYYRLCEDDQEQMMEHEITDFGSDGEDVETQVIPLITTVTEFTIH